MSLRIYSVKDFGAVADGKTINTAAIQKAIDKCSADGGGIVQICGGTFLSGTIALKDMVELRIEADAVLLGSPDCNDYPEIPWKHVVTEKLPRYRGTCFIRADECHHIAITGEGTIDGNGTAFVEPIPDARPDSPVQFRRIDAPTPPRVVMFAGCSNIRIHGITMINQPAGWSYWLTDCDLAVFDDVKILADLRYPNSDGIHINSSRNVRIINSTIRTGDDSIVVRANNSALAENKICEDVTVTNCSLTRHTAGVRLGWINDGTIRNCLFSNIVMTDCLSGVSICLPAPSKCIAPSDVGREATLIENIGFQNIQMDRTLSRPLNMHIDRNKAVQCEAVRNIRFNGLYSKSRQMPMIIGRKGNEISDISFNNCTFEVTPYATEQSHDGYSIMSPFFTNTKNLRLTDTTFTITDTDEYPVYD